MKNIMLAATLLLLAIGCTKKQDTPDPCEGVVCNNGGTCNKGTCSCPEGYSGEHCENISRSNLLGIYNCHIKGSFTHNNTNPNPNCNINMTFDSSFTVTIKENPNYIQGLLIDSIFSSEIKIDLLTPKTLQSINNFILRSTKNGCPDLGSFCGNPLATTGEINGKTIIITNSSNCKTTSGSWTETNTSNFTCTMVKQ